MENINPLLWAQVASQAISNLKESLKDPTLGTEIILISQVQQSQYINDLSPKDLQQFLIKMNKYLQNLWVSENSRYTQNIDEYIEREFEFEKFKLKKASS